MTGTNLHSNTSEKGRLLKTIGSLARLLFPDPEADKDKGQLVYRVAQFPGEVIRGSDRWEKRIIELGDGRSVGEIKGVLYRDELIAGASAVDIGMWKRGFDRSVDRVIAELVARGILHLRQN